LELGLKYSIILRPVYVDIALFMHVSIILYTSCTSIPYLLSTPLSLAISSASRPGKVTELTLQSSMTVSLIIKATLPDSSPTGGRLLSCSLLAPIANLDPSGENARHEIEV
jgi:hypothetical protein